jgi:hypothetical protein
MGANTSRRLRITSAVNVMAQIAQGVALAFQFARKVSIDYFAALPRERFKRRGIGFGCVRHAA